MYNSHYRISGGTSPHIQNKHSLTYDSKLDIHQKIECLDEQWSKLEMDQENSMLQIEKIFQKIFYEVGSSKERKNFKLEQKIDNLDRHITITVNIEKQAILLSKERLKHQVESKQRIIHQILSGQVKEEEIFQRQISTIIEKRLAEIRKKMVKQAPKIEKYKFAKKKQPENNLKHKLTQKSDVIESILSSNKQEIKKMKKQSQKLIREYLRVKDQLENARTDREDKQEQILAKIQEISLGDRTNEETISKIQ